MSHILTLVHFEAREQILQNMLNVLEVKKNTEPYMVQDSL